MVPRAASQLSNDLTVIESQALWAPNSILVGGLTTEVGMSKFSVSVPGFRNRKSSSNDQPVNSNIFTSSGSPTSFPSILRSEWQVAMVFKAAV